MLKAGAGRSDITPPVGIAHAGWGAQTHQVSEGNDMPLYVTALTLSNADLQVAIVDIDIAILTIAQDAEMRDLITQRTGIPGGNIRISYSHTHSAPATFSDWLTEGMELVEQWLRDLPGAAADAVAQAIEAQVPAVPSFGVGKCDININRRPADDAGNLFTGRNWQGFVDRSVEVVGLDDMDGDPVATLVNYACHPTIMGHLNKWVTPDFPGPMRRVVEQTVGGTCLFLQGASGNQGPVDGFTGGPARIPQGRGGAWSGGVQGAAPDGPVRAQREARRDTGIGRRPWNLRGRGRERAGRRARRLVGRCRSAGQRRYLARRGAGRI